MKKTIPITIAGQLFHIEEDAYQALQAYLDSIKAHFDGLPERDEVIADIESRIAERFLENSKAENKIVTIDQVNSLIASMGNVEDFDDEAPKQKQQTNATPQKKRLYRNPNDAIIAGVCSGIAAYFNIDPLIVRVLWGASLFLGGGGLIAYIIFWIIMPEAKTTTEQLQMRGQPVTLESVNEMVKEKVNEVKDRGIFRKIIAFPFMVIGIFFKNLWIIIRALVGIALTVVAGLGIFFLSFVALNMIFNTNSQYIDFPIRDLLTSSQYFLGLLAGYFPSLCHSF